jgi:hypothetical protein
MTAPARTGDVVFTSHPARRGFAWLLESWAMFSRARMPWLVLISIYYVILLLVNVVPIVGQLVWPLLKPVFAVGLLAAAWAQERGGAPGPADLFKGFKANVRALLPLGVVFIAWGPAPRRRRSRRCRVRGCRQGSCSVRWSRCR